MLMRHPVSGRRPVVPLRPRARPTFWPGRRPLPGFVVPRPPWENAEQNYLPSRIPPMPASEGVHREGVTPRNGEIFMLSRNLLFHNDFYSEPADKIAIGDENFSIISISWRKTSLPAFFPVLRGDFDWIRYESGSLGREVEDAGAGSRSPAPMMPLGSTTSAPKWSLVPGRVPCRRTKTQDGRRHVPCEEPEGQLSPW
jgi:hypothetical protein